MQQMVTLRAYIAAKERREEEEAESLARLRRSLRKNTEAFDWAMAGLFAAFGVIAIMTLLTLVVGIISKIGQ